MAHAARDRLAIRVTSDEARTQKRSAGQPRDSSNGYAERELLEEATAESIVDEALAGYERTIPPGRLAEVRAYMIAKLLATRGGRERLRRIAPDPVVAESGEADTSGAVPIKKGMQGGGAA